MNDSLMRKNLIELLKGGSAHTTVKKALAGVNPELRHVRPAPGLHTVYEELEHVRIAQEDILRYTLDPSWTSPKWPDGYWPGHVEEVTEEMWEEAVSHCLGDLDEVIRLVRDTDLDLTAEIPHDNGRTYLREILLVADHNAYHVGQIVQTRKHLGDWRR
jgi:hypothetical protein